MAQGKVSNSIILDSQTDEDQGENLGNKREPALGIRCDNECPKFRSDFGWSTAANDQAETISVRRDAVANNPAEANLH